MKNPPIHKACGLPLVEIEFQRASNTTFVFDEKTGGYEQTCGQGQGVAIVCQHCYTEVDQEERDLIYQHLPFGVRR